MDRIVSESLDSKRPEVIPGDSDMDGLSSAAWLMRESLKPRLTECLYFALPSNHEAKKAEYSI